MSETLTAPEEQKVETTGRPQMVIQPQDLASNFFDVAKPIPAVQEPVKQPEQKQEVKENTKPVTVEEEEVIDEDESYKREFGKTKEELKTEYEELRKFRETKPEEVKFENDESKNLYELIRQGKKKEVREILDRQEKLEHFTTAEVSKDTAADIIKLGMQLSNKLLTKEDVDFKYNQEYGIPKEPVQRSSETDEEFSERMDMWKERVTTMEMKKIVDAKMAVPQLEQLKKQIVLPEIQKPEQQVQKPLTQEELDAVKKYNDAYNDSVDNSMKNFNGISVSVKNEVVDFPVTFGVTNEDKVSLTNLLKDFSKENYDTNSLFAALWVNEDGTLKTDQMIEDYFLIKNKKNILQKVANDISAKTLESYLKGKKNININENNQSGTTVLTKENKTEMDEIRDQFFGGTSKQ